MCNKSVILRLLYAAMRQEPCQELLACKRRKSGIVDGLVTARWPGWVCWNKGAGATVQAHVGQFYLCTVLQAEYNPVLFGNQVLARVFSEIKESQKQDIIPLNLLSIEKYCRSKMYVSMLANELTVSSQLDWCQITLAYRY